MLDGIKIKYMNKENVNKLVRNLSAFGVSIALMSCSPNVAFANGFSSFIFNNLGITTTQPNSSNIQSKTDSNKSLTLHDVSESDDLSYLNAYTDLEYLTINGSGMGRGIEKLPHLKKLTINTLNVDFQYLEFLKKCNGNLVVEINSINAFNTDLLESYTTIKNLNIYVSDKSNIDFKKLSFLKNLTISGLKYNIPIFFSSEDYEYLTNAGVSVSIMDENDKDIYAGFMEIDSKLYDIINSLDITDDMSLEDKMDLILIYVLENCEYEPNLTELDNRLIMPFYKDGYLSSFFNNDTQICGNYAAITKALAHRIGLESYLIESYKHAWNLIEIDGEYYFCDPTFLDSSPVVLGYSGEEKLSEDVLRDNNSSEKEKLVWYMVDYDYYLEYRKEHDKDQTFHAPRNLPSFLVINQDKNDSNVTVSFSNSKKIISVHKNSLFGILSCFGFLHPVLDKKRDTTIDSDEEKKDFAHSH